MKYARLTVALVMVALLAGCATMYPVPPVSVCAKPEAVGSVICAISAKLGTTPEQMNDMLLDVALVPIATKIQDAKQIRDAIDKANKWVVERDVLSIKGIITYLVSEAKIDPALALLLSRRLVFLQVPGLEDQALTAFDKELVKKHFANQWEQMSWF